MDYVSILIVSIVLQLFFNEFTIFGVFTVIGKVNLDAHKAISKVAWNVEIEGLNDHHDNLFENLNSNPKNLSDVPLE